MFSGCLIYYLYNNTVSIRPDTRLLVTCSDFDRSLPVYFVLAMTSAPSREGTQLALTGAPSQSLSTQESAPQLDVQSSRSVALDALGPMVVNSDGVRASSQSIGSAILMNEQTLSRIANWASMSELERARTLRVLSARNK